MTDHDTLQDELTQADLAEQERDALVDTLVCETGEALLSAQSFAEEAGRKLRELTSNAVYDVELAEGYTGRDALSELDDALRSLRNAERIIAARARLLVQNR